MTKTQTHFAVEKAQSEIRTRVLEIRAIPDGQLTPEQRAERTELDKRYAAGEIKFRASIDALQVEQAAGVTVDAEARALRQLTQRASMGAIFESVVEQRQLADGATRELQEHFRVGPHAVPIEMLRNGLRSEHRAISPAPTNVGTDEQPVEQPVFALGDAAFFGVDMPVVGPGDSVFPVLTSRPVPEGPHTGSAVVGETTGAFSAEALSPGRLQASFFYRRSDAARFSGMSESLRSALSLGLSEALDQKLVAQIESDVSRTNRSSVSDYGHYKGVVTAHVDGRYATSEADVRTILGSATFVHANTRYKSSESDESAIDAMRRLSGGLRVSAHVGDVSSHKQDILVRRGMRRDAVAALWGGVQLILDEVSGATKGEITVTGVLLAAFKIIRVGGFARIQTQHQ